MMMMMVMTMMNEVKVMMMIFPLYISLVYMLVSHSFKRELYVDFSFLILIFK